MTNDPIAAENYDNSQHSVSQLNTDNTHRTEHGSPVRRFLRSNPSSMWTDSAEASSEESFTSLRGHGPNGRPVRKKISLGQRIGRWLTGKLGPVFSWAHNYNWLTNKAHSFLEIPVTAELMAKCDKCRETNIPKVWWCADCHMHLHGESKKFAPRPCLNMPAEPLEDNTPLLAYFPTKGPRVSPVLIRCLYALRSPDKMNNPHVYRVFDQQKDPRCLIEHMLGNEPVDLSQLPLTTITGMIQRLFAEGYPDPLMKGWFFVRPQEPLSHMELSWMMKYVSFEHADTLACMMLHIHSMLDASEVNGLVRKDSALIFGPMLFGYPEKSKGRTPEDVAIVEDVMKWLLDVDPRFWERRLEKAFKRGVPAS